MSPCARALKFNCLLSQVDRNVDSDDARTAKRRRRDRRAPPLRQTGGGLRPSPHENRGLVASHLIQPMRKQESSPFQVHLPKPLTRRPVVIGLRKSWIGIGNRVQKGALPPFPNTSRTYNILFNLPQTRYPAPTALIHKSTMSID